MARANTIVLVKNMSSRRDDRVSRLLARRGFTLDWRYPFDGQSLPEPAAHHAGAVIYGGSQSANDTDNLPYLADEIRWTERWLGAGKPFLGLCLGGQLLARALGGEVGRHADGLHEIGYRRVEPTAAGAELLPEPMHFFQWHNESFSLPAGAELLARGTDFPNQAYRYNGNVYGLQFHPEVTDAVMHRWLHEAAHMLVHPGADQPARQHADAAKHGPKVGRWLGGFLDRWLA